MATHPRPHAAVEDLSLSLSSLKDAREHTRATQRAKKAGDRAKGRRGARGGEKEGTDNHSNTPL
ncbi:hypothetical protein EWM64_g3924 [Hericium alpestre]|uniref:Uncharacterized protein n=1 Tax=Hericium alpestre TaxID=135208 RepID=A0A4Z0A320_9AGAM|nr:hypothetical protein EWM64_g3924 [Hericium alpestre]